MKKPLNGSGYLRPLNQKLNAEIILLLNPDHPRY
jgi:hypothetical protein